MGDIKVKRESDIKIKKFEKAKVYTQKLKSNIVNVKEKTDSIKNNDESINEYGVNQILDKTNRIVNIGIDKFNKYGQKSVREIIKKKINDRNVKKTTKAIKNTHKTAKNTVKATTKLEKETIKGIKKAYQISKATAKATIKSVKAGIKATISAIKAIISAMNTLISFLIAGGWIVVIVIIIICMIALIISSVFGIFFSNELKGELSVSSVMLELNVEFNKKIERYKVQYPAEEYDINYNRASWKNVLAVYSVVLSNGNNETDVITMDKNKAKILKKVFWDMHEFNPKLDQELIKKKISDGRGGERVVDAIKKTLHLTIRVKSIEEISNEYNFNEAQRNQLYELLNEKNDENWSNVINSSGSSDIVEVARKELGNVGGQPYWSWYGFKSRVEWCACFVSWCANQCNYIERGIIPKFASCQNEGIVWFKNHGLWKEKDFIPKQGDIIFFDWESDGKSDHVGIVEEVENGKVYTIEGNSNGDTCRQKEYKINSSVICGYGTPMY